MNTQKSSSRLTNAIMLTLSVSLLAAPFIYAETNKTVAPPEHTVAITTPSAAETGLQSLGKTVFAQLKTAEQAALNKNRTDFVKALEQSRDALNKVEAREQKLNQTMDEPINTFSLFPVSKVKDDLDAASAAGDTDTPYWPGALEAVQNALASFQWYDQGPAKSLLDAYSYVIDAYSVATAPEFRSDQLQTVLDLLGNAADALQTNPDGITLQEETRSLIDKVTPENSDIKQLLKDIRQQISDSRQSSEAQYLADIAPKTTGSQ